MNGVDRPPANVSRPTATISAAAGNTPRAGRSDQPERAFGRGLAGMKRKKPGPMWARPTKRSDGRVRAGGRVGLVGKTRSDPPDLPALPDPVRYQMKRAPILPVRG